MTTRNRAEFLVKLKQARIEANLTQCEVGAQMNCSQAAICKKERGARAIYAWELLELCKIYGQPLDYFL
ncbi:hypothetical protein BZZ01_04960 [Nostocales cyanobacterium HT-58-2]|nr:hypothetical protein BZZ01_04960 [Nostocales cyanobacterium HT-58-2]